MGVSIEYLNKMNITLKQNDKFIKNQLLVSDSMIEWYDTNA
jgi:hypothetical protein